MTRLRPLLALALLLLASVPGAAAQAALRPVDEAASQPDFFTFRAQLQAAVARHDVAAVLGAVDPKILVSFGGGYGVEAFKEDWKLDKPDSRLWESLAVVLALGGAFEPNGTFVAPYTFTEWPDDLDAFENVAVIGSNVRVRSAPSADASVLTSVSFAILKVVHSAQAGDAWTSVRLPDGRIGFISKKLVRSSVDYRAFFAKKAGGWKLVTFVAGD